MGEKKKTFEEQCSSAGIKPETYEKLAAEDFDTVDSVKLLTDEDIKDLQLSKGQTRTLEKWRNNLNLPSRKKAAKDDPRSERAFEFNTFEK